MHTKLWVGVACVWGASACGHAQPASSTPVGPHELAVAVPIHEDANLAQRHLSYLDAYTVGERPQDGRRPRVALVAPALHGEATNQGASAESELIERFVLTHGIEGQKPVDEAQTFKAGERVYAFVAITNYEGTKFALNLRWTQDDAALAQPTAVNIGTSKHWRAWSSRRAPEQPGSYRCVVETDDGQPVAELPFRVEI